MSKPTGPEGLSSEHNEPLLDFLAEASATYAGSTDRDANFEVLKAVPGIDPVLAVVDGRPESIPQSGWIVNSHVAPGYGGVINVYRYEEGSLNYGHVSDGREKYGQARVYFNFDGYGRHTVAYENPAFPHKSVEPYNRMPQASYMGLAFADTDIVELENGGRILDEKEPMVARWNSMYFSMDWDDIDRGREYMSSVDVNRVTGDINDVRQIMAHLSFAMGLGKHDIETLVSTVYQKISPVA